MKLTIEALLVLVGFAGGVIFSGAVRAFVDKQVLSLLRRVTEIEAAAKSEGDALRARILELENKVKAIV